MRFGRPAHTATEQLDVSESALSTAELAVELKLLSQRLRLAADRLAGMHGVERRSGENDHP